MPLSRAPLGEPAHYICVTIRLVVLTLSTRGIGLETSILFVKEGAKVMMADISAPALEKAKAKVLELVPHAHVDTKVNTCEPHPPSSLTP